MCEHVVARPPASAATAGPTWPPVTATVAPWAVVPVRVLAANWLGTLQLSPIAVPPEALLLPCPAPQCGPPIDFDRVHTAGSDPFCSQAQAEGACSLLRVSRQSL